MEESFLIKSRKVVVFLAEDEEYALPIESVLSIEKPDALAFQDFLQPGKSALGNDGQRWKGGYPLHPTIVQEPVKSLI
ncbi:hypothetical protein Q8G35_12795 [Peribacillus simplex]|uniref:Uncharacterized protein n=2 Tax=Peribacillus TaxID=2675229 RepID=A0AA90SWG5_9BACI|nr:MULTISPECIES: hypothetical protein [Peribacillus]MDP1419283.1 hypothetical protein [Peribacillus simplex]MDP1451980.1 hypothetical protein [Peribacillus frigoritolerans]